MSILVTELTERETLPHGIRVPEFLLHQPVIDPSQAAEFARDAHLPNVTYENPDADSMIGLQFCRGRRMTIDQAQRSTDIRTIPRTPAELLYYFNNPDGNRLDEITRAFDTELRAIEEDLLQLELDILRSAGEKLPGHFTNLTQYLTWVAEHTENPFQDPFTPNTEELFAMRFGFLKKHADTVGNAFGDFNPVSGWKSRLSHFYEPSGILKDKTSLMDKTFYQQHSNHGKVQYLAERLGDYPDDSLLFHTTSVREALSIASTGRFVIGGKLGGVSFSANGVTHPRGGHADRNAPTHIALVGQYAWLRDHCNALSYPEFAYEFEQEVRVPVELPAGLLIGAVPIQKDLFPQTLRSGYAGNTLIGGPVVDEWRTRYATTGRLLNDDDQKIIRGAL